MSVLMLIKIIVFTDSDNTRHWYLDRSVQTAGCCAVDKMLVMLDGVRKEMCKQLISM
jgi:hypothetical protein